MMWTIYSDGGAAPSNPGPCGWGAVVVQPDGGQQRHWGFVGPGTNQIAEIFGALEGISVTPLNAKVALFSDSQYVVKGLNKWRSGWERRGFRNASNQPVANLALWKRLFAAVDARSVTAKWVKAHNGDPLNELADQLVARAIKSRTTGSEMPTLSRNGASHVL